MMEKKAFSPSESTKVAAQKQETKVLQKATLGLSIIFLVFIFISFPHTLELSPFVPFTHREPLSLHERALKILSGNPLIDGHNDLLIRIRATYGNQIYGSNFTEPFENGTLTGETDLERMRQGKYAGAFWSAFYPCQKDIFDFSDEQYDPSMPNSNLCPPPGPVLSVSWTERALALDESAMHIEQDSHISSPF